MPITKAIARYTRGATVTIPSGEVVILESVRDLNRNRIKYRVETPLGTRFWILESDILPDYPEEDGPRCWSCDATKASKDSRCACDGGFNRNERADDEAQMDLDHHQMVYGSGYGDVFDPIPADVFYRNWRR